MKRLYGKCEALILLGLGTALLWFALSDRYGLLMNPRFRWLTVTGCVLLLAMGLAALFDKQKRHPVNILVFGVLLAAALIGKPYLPGDDSLAMREPELPAGLWDQVDQDRFPRRELQDLYLDPEEALGRSSGLTTIGIAKRLDALDAQGSFAIMTPIMFCCYADAFAGGFRVPYGDWETIEDGEWVMVSGHLAPETAGITLPNFRFGAAMLSAVNDEFVIRPETVMSYNRLDQLPQLTEQLSGSNTELFADYLQRTELWNRLREKGPFTVFVPVDQAVEALGDDFFTGLPPDEINRIFAGHIVPGRLLTRDLMELNTLEALNGEALDVEAVNGKLRISGSRLLFKNKEARNGVIHYIYPVIMPDDPDSDRPDDPDSDRIDEQ